MIEKKRILVALIGLAILPIFLNSALAADKLFLVANQKALDQAKDLITTLNNESISIAIVMDQFEKAKKEKYIFVLGGAKGPGSVDDFIKQVLTPQELESSAQGAKFFVKENVFSPGQTIIVFTGSDETAAAEVRKSNRKTWWGLLAKWFDLDTSLPMVY